MRRAKTRSQLAELGEIAKTMRAASAQAGKVLLLVPIFLLEILEECV